MKAVILTLMSCISIRGYAQQPSTSPSLPINTAGGTSAANINEVDLPRKSPVGFLAISVAEVAGSDLRDRSSNAAVMTTNAVGLTYNTSPEAKVGYRQYFTYLRDADKGNPFEISNAVLTFTQKFGGFLGSKEVSPLLWYYLPTSEKAQANRSNGKFRATTFVTWALGTRWDFTYFFDPRQSFIPTSVAKDGTEVFSHTTWIHGGNFAYNFNDQISVYQGLGTTEDFRTSDLSLIDETIDLSTGMYISLGPILLIPDMTNSVATKKGRESVTGRKPSSTLYRAEETIYSVSMLANF